MQSLGVKLGRLGSSKGTRRRRGKPGWSFSNSGGGRRSGISLTVSQGWLGTAHGAVISTRGRRRIATRSWRIAASLLLIGTVTYGLTAGGHVQRLLTDFAAGTSSAVMRAGFTVQELTIEGQNRTSNDAIVQALDIGSGTSMLSFDTLAAQARLEQLPWVRRAQIMRLLPSTLQVVIEEREPFVRWQLDGQLYLADAEGRRLGPAKGARSDLPLIVGEGAGKHAQALFAALAAHPDLRERMVAAIRVADRRWTLKLSNGVEIRLPENDIERALGKLVALETMHRLLEGEVLAVDLRLPDRVSLRLTDEAAKRWQHVLKQNPEHGRKRSAQDT